MKSERGGKLELTLNSKNAPELRISEGYRDMLKEYDRGAKKDRRQKDRALLVAKAMNEADARTRSARVSLPRRGPDRKSPALGSRLVNPFAASM